MNPAFPCADQDSACIRIDFVFLHFSTFLLSFYRANAARAQAPLLRRALRAFARLARAAPPRRSGSRGKERKFRDKFPRSGKFPGSSGRTLTRNEAGVLEVPGARGSNVPKRCHGNRFPPRPPMRRAATTRSEAARGGKRESRQSTRAPHGALSVGRWAGCAGRRGCKGAARLLPPGRVQGTAARAGSLPRRCGDMKRPPPNAQ